MESNCLLMSSQKFPTGPYREPEESCPHFRIIFFKNQFEYCLTKNVYGFKVLFFLLVFRRKFCVFLTSPMIETCSKIKVNLNSNSYLNDVTVLFYMSLGYNNSFLKYILKFNLYYSEKHRSVLFC